ncbi:MAG: hypothetical protein HLX47_13085 [Staphylococcus sp.]|uniref:hypothetical protein n=1 Tax=Staphylococcus sp. TaxID=29387 RepID=UPI0017D40F50|nr:hypothetical protein [Staphylococcus sp.]NWN86797.1 hypothetical protein [Staphylococcus sp.]
MSVIKSFSVNNGDMFYIKHGSDNFTMIDCNLNDENQEKILDELIKASSSKGISRFISTHPDEDHISGLSYIEEKMGISNFYCVSNDAIKIDPSKDFMKYQNLRDSSKAFHIYKNCSRKWMNVEDDNRKSSGLSILWPDTSNQDYKNELLEVSKGESPNNISTIIQYSLENGVNVLWMGDLETDFMKKIEKHVEWPKIDILFAPHHGRKTGRIPKSILDKLNPKVIVIGEADTLSLDYYHGYNKITQNSTGDIIFDCLPKKVHIHVKKEGYCTEYLDIENIENQLRKPGFNYIGTLNL